MRPRSIRTRPASACARAPGAPSSGPAAGAETGPLRTLDVARPVVIEVDFARGSQADHAAIVPGVERQGDRGVRIASDDPVVAYRGFLAAIRLADGVA